MRILSTILLSTLLASNLTANAKPKSPLALRPAVAYPNANLKHALVGEYQYTGFDDKGVKIVEGRLTITSVRTRHLYGGIRVQIKGSWDFKEVVHRDGIGPQVGAGKLDGSMIHETAIIQLNPGLDDGGVLLAGTLTDNRFTGTWSVENEAGDEGEGTFVAFKITRYCV
jgi:hypothetical protein